MFDIKKMFKEIFVFYRQIKQRTEPDLVLWVYIRNVMMEKFREDGDNVDRYRLALKKALGYDRNRPTDDWQGNAGKEAEANRLDRQDRLERVTEAEQRVEKQLTDIREIPKEDLDTILNNTPEENYVIHPGTNQRITEKAYYDERKDKYTRDFNFNLSADWPLVNEIIMTEIQLMRFDNYLREHPNRFVGEHRNKTFVRLCDAQKALGISREQRVDSEDAMKDTFADAVDTFEGFLQSGVDLDTLFVYEQLEMLLQKYDRGVERNQPEISEATFLWQTRGVSPEQA